jgi:UDP-N-acetyl-D-galactosamine dehydrogenase
MEFPSVQTRVSWRTLQRCRPILPSSKAQESEYYPEILLAGRRINDSMGSSEAAEIVKKMVQRDITVKGASVLIIRFTFKENCPDIRNTRVIDIYHDLNEHWHQCICM